MMDRRDREALLRRIRGDARCLADHFDLEYKGIQSERANVRARYGACFEDGLIKLRLWNLRTGRPLKYSSLIDTLCHELAHLRHFDHSERFKRFYLRILGWAREQGIYRPGDRRQAAGRGLAQRVPKKNGVAVFAEPRSRFEAPPWERPAAAKATSCAFRPAARPAPPRAANVVGPTSAENSPAPEMSRASQLLLLELPAGDQPPTRRRASKAGKTSGKAGQTSCKAGQTSCKAGNAGKTSVTSPRVQLALF